MGEVAAFAQVLEHKGLLKTILEQVRFARARFGTYDVIDFVFVLIGYVVSGEPTLFFAQKHHLGRFSFQMMLQEQLHSLLRTVNSGNRP